MSTILVLGGGGFLANHIAAYYRHCGWRVVVVGASAKSGIGAAHYRWRLPQHEFGNLLARESPALCIGAAGRSSVQLSFQDPLGDFENSALLNAFVLDKIRRVSPSTSYIYLSSAAVYGEPISLPVSEATQVAPISPYGWHRYLAERVLTEYSQIYGLKTASLRIFSAYGPGLRRQVVWDLVDRAIKTMGKPLTLFGNPEDSRDFIHGADVATAVASLAQNGSLTGETYNLASGIETTIADLAHLIQRILGVKPSVIFDHKRAPGVPGRWHADIQQLTKMGFSPKITLERGINGVIQEAKRLGG